MTDVVAEPEVVLEAPTTLQKVLAELLGTFVLVFIGCGTALLSQGDYVATGLAFGLAVLTMAYAVGRLSGGHFNPAVTLGAALAGRLPWRLAPLYWVSQVVGGVLAGAVLWVTMHGFPGFSSRQAFATNGYGDQSANGYAWWAALVLELVLTGVFLLVILAVTDARNEHPALAPLAIGLALAMIHFASMPATGTSVNPARSIGVALFAGTDHVLQLWLFIVAPMLGAALMGGLYPLVFGGPEAVPGSGLSLGRARTHAPDQYQQQWNAEAWQQQYAAQWQGYDPQHGQAGYPQGHPSQQPSQQPGQQPQHPGQQPWAPAGEAWQGGWQPPHQQPPQQPQADPGSPGHHRVAGQPGWGQPPAPPSPVPGQQHFGAPPEQWADEDEDGRTQIRPHDAP